MLTTALSLPTLGLSFLEGLALILSPCILPILPLILGASLDSGRARPFGIVTGFVLAFSVFAIVSRKLLAASGIDSEIVRDISLVLLGVFGLVMLFPKLSDRWSRAFTGLAGGSNTLMNRVQSNGFGGGLVIGLLVGVVWTPCAGPLLGAAILQIIQADSDAAAFASIAAFAIGAGVPMFLIAVSGRKIIDRMGFLKRHSDTIRRVVGIIMIAAAISIYTGLDLKLVSWQAQNEAKSQTTKTEFSNPQPAPEFAGLTDWINSQPLNLESLRGKVVLVDFWTYSCINCIRTMPYITRWHDTYKDDGLVIIGIHAPEFAFEKKRANVEKAVRDYGIQYPVALDNDFTTWKAYKSRAWPAHYLIDRQGRIVYTHFGEGKYDVMENNIRALLGLPGASTIENPAIRTSEQTPETYLGYARTENFIGTQIRDTVSAYSFPESLAQHQWALSGQWTAEKQRVVSGDNAALRLSFHAGKVFIVLGGPAQKVTVLLNGKSPGRNAGKDVKDGILHVDGERLYEVVDMGMLAGRDATIEIRPESAGLTAYAFTFGK